MPRFLIPAVLAVPALGLALPAPQQATQRYRIELAQTSVVDLSAFGQGEQTTDIAYEGFVTVTLTDSAGGKAYHAVLDSSKAIKAAPAGAGTNIEGTAGAAYHGFITREGRTEGFKVMGDTTTAPTAGVFEQVLNDLYPTVLGGLTAGATWVDTSSTTTDQGGGTTVAETITTYTVAGPETWQGQSAVKINTTSAVKLSMASTQANMDGTGKGDGAYYVTPQGGLLGFTRTTTGDLLYITPQGDVPITQTGSLTVTPVR